MNYMMGHDDRSEVEARRRLWMFGKIWLLLEAAGPREVEPSWFKPSHETLKNDIYIAANLINDSLRIGCLLTTSKKNLIGLAPKPTEIGDEIWILFGCSEPIVLRPVDNKYLVVGPAYVDSIMDGEAVEEVPGHVKDGERQRGL